MNKPQKILLQQVALSLCDLEEGPGSDSYNHLEELEVLEEISNSKFPVLLAFSPHHDRHFAMKVFHYNGEHINDSYLNECRFLALKHPHIISMIDAVDKRKAYCGGETFCISYILLELGFCDFDVLLGVIDFTNDEKLVRTFFRQLVDGLEYLHSQGIFHLDLKTQNMILGEDYCIRIIDFGGSCTAGDQKLICFGTPNFKKNCMDPAKADIYSLGIILFALTTGFLPYLEGQAIKDYKLQELLLNDPNEFWAAHEEIEVAHSKLNPDFKSLFISLTRPIPKARLDLNQIKKSKWFQGPIYNKQQLKPLLENRVKNFISS